MADLLLIAKKTFRSKKWSCCLNSRRWGLECLHFHLAEGKFAAFLVQDLHSNLEAYQWLTLKLESKLLQLVQRLSFELSFGQAWQLSKKDPNYNSIARTTDDGIHSWRIVSFKSVLLTNGYFHWKLQ